VILFLGINAIFELVIHVPDKDKYCTKIILCQYFDFLAVPVEWWVALDFKGSLASPLRLASLATCKWSTVISSSELRGGGGGRYTKT
jgi:hypothetical protein